MNMIRIERDFHGEKISIESGRIAKQAGGSVLVRYGDSIVMVTACSGADKDGDFLPLTIDYIEKTYAAGRIPGGFFKREGRLSERETLTSRLLDRPIRPLFPERFNKEIQVVATVLSADQENDTDVLAVCGASAALTNSDLPFEGPVAAVRVARVKGKLLINPTKSQLVGSDMTFVVAGTRDAITMVEGGAAEVDEKDVLEALFYAHEQMQPLIDMQLELQEKVGKAKLTVKAVQEDEAFKKQVHDFLVPKLSPAFVIKDKLERRDVVAGIKDEMKAQFLIAGDAALEAKSRLLGRVFEDTQYHLVRKMVFDKGVRIDGRDNKTVRPIAIEVGFLPRTHGSALFTRGETQAIVTTTLGTEQEAQRMEGLMGEEMKTFMLHYNFPGYSVGEAKPMRGPGRREQGHGALAERAVKAVMPGSKEFPYVVRIVSDITESNGSSSMASVCGASLALMDAGVPIKASVAGVAMGLMKEDKNTVILTDILGDEDHLGDMDFKVCGTKKGITALQMDIKIKGLDKQTVDTALLQARDGRLHILGEMDRVISESRKKMSEYAPRILTIKINPEKIRDVIGSGGKTIRSIQESCGVKVDISDDGTINIASVSDSKAKAALAMIEGLTEEAVIGKLYKGLVKRIADFGAFVEIIPGTDGLVHISQLTEDRVRSVTDVIQEGDEVWVKVLDVDRQGKIRLSMKDAVAEMAQKQS
jgi:polyribonucleotide nucleotidyltransferase